MKVPPDAKSPYAPPRIGERPRLLCSFSIESSFLGGSLAVSPDQNLWSCGRRRCCVFDLDGKHLFDVTSEFIREPVRIAFSSLANEAFLLDLFTSTVIRCTLHGKVIGQFPVPRVGRTPFLTVDPQGRLVAGLGAQLSIFNLDGTPVETVKLPCTIRAAAFNSVGQVVVATDSDVQVSFARSRISIASRRCGIPGQAPASKRCLIFLLAPFRQFCSILMTTCLSLVFGSKRFRQTDGA